MRRLLIVAPIAFALAIGAVVGARTPTRIVQTPTTQTITVGSSDFEFDPATDAPVGTCLEEVILGQQGKVIARGFVWVQQGDVFVVSDEGWWADVTDKPGWREALPDECGSVTFAGGN